MATVQGSCGTGQISYRETVKVLLVEGSCRVKSEKNPAEVRDPTVLAAVAREFLIRSECW